MSIDFKLITEFHTYEGLLNQHPETGARGEGSYVSDYTNKIFGAPYQLLDNVDRRYGDINSHVGSEYLKNILLNSPILTIRPGMPKYTGNQDPTNLGTMMQNAYIDSTGEDGGSTADFVESFLKELATNTIFGTGAKLQRRLYGFRETYWDYIQYVNYMCQSVAVFLNLTKGLKTPGGETLPTGVSMHGGPDGQEDFATANWQNYRFLDSTRVQTPLEYFSSLLGVGVAEGKKALFTGLGAAGIAAAVTHPLPSLAVAGLGAALVASADAVTEDDVGTKALTEVIGFTANLIEATWETAEASSVAGLMADKVTTVQFVVEPGEFGESLQNETTKSVVESAVDGIRDTVGYELQWIGNSHADIGLINSMVASLGNTTADALINVSKLMSGVTGGFISDIFSGAIKSIRGQKMIYPQIYRSSTSSMNYEFDVVLTSPYGDIYNYYMNIVVPLLHLVALAAPRMVTSNTITSPFLVQAFIPGMCTCNLGIIENMTITKNPGGKHVSVNGYPLTVKVHFTVKELYNALSISGANEPASFLYNETLNDYLANLAGMMPSIDMYREQRANALKNAKEYFTGDDQLWLNDAVQGIIERVENAVGYTG